MGDWVKGPRVPPVLSQSPSPPVPQSGTGVSFVLHESDRTCARVELKGDTTSIRWDREAAAHLARRAGFGATPAELDASVAMGVDAAVDQLVNYDAIDNSALETALQALTTATPPATAPVYDLSNINGVAKWFLHRMVFTRRPLEEKMTYFWNGHFTSGIAKVQGVTLMLNQNKTQRQYALGSFDDLVVKMSQDAAMLVWLDNATSRVGRPNENYARELMELFTLGVDEYKQADVSEVARALTGWTIQGYTGADNYNGAKFLDNPAFHDNGVKTILGQTGNWNGYDAIRIILEASDERGSVSGRFLSRKLWTYFAYHDPPDWAVQELTGVYVSSNRSIRAVVDRLFRMPEFYEAHARKVLVRSPIEYAAALLRQLEAKTDMSTPVNSLVAMGQPLFNPSDAKGPEGDMDWINTGTVFARASMTNTIVNNRGTTGTRIDLAQLLAGKTLTTPTDVVNALADRLGLADAPPQVRATWAKYVDSKSDGSRGYWQNTSAQLDQKARGLIHLMLTSSDYHLC